MYVQGLGQGPATFMTIVQGPLTTLCSLSQTTVVAEAEAVGTATAQAGHPTTKGHMGATEEVLGAVPPTKANKVGLERQMAQHGGLRATYKL